MQIDGTQQHGRTPNTDGVAAATAEAATHTKCSSLSKEIYVPPAIEMYGRLAPKFNKLLPSSTSSCSRLPSPNGHKRAFSCYRCKVAHFAVGGGSTCDGIHWLQRHIR